MQKDLTLTSFQIDPYDAVAMRRFLGWPPASLTGDVTPAFDHEVANYNTRLLVEEDVFYLDSYVNEMEGPNAERFPLTMEECADVAKECLTGRLKVRDLALSVRRHKK